MGGARGSSAVEGFKMLLNDFVGSGAELRAFRFVLEAERSEQHHAQDHNLWIDSLIRTLTPKFGTNRKPSTLWEGKCEGKLSPFTKNEHSSSTKMTAL